MTNTKLRQLSADEITTWVTPADALARIQAIAGSGDAAEHVIFAYLQDGLIEAAAHTRLVEGYDQSPLLNMTIIPSVWKDAKSHGFGKSFWQTSQLESYFDNGRRFRRFHGVRFDPSGLERIVRDIRPESTRVNTGRPESPEPETKMPPVADADLRAWHAVYCKAYGASDKPLGHALDSARGMFRDKFVSRDRVRELFEPRKAGKKAKPTAN